MNDSLVNDGFEIRREVFSDSQVRELRDEADSVAEAAGTTCVRHLRERSTLFDALCVSESLLSLIPGDLRPVRSILFDKTAEENWPVLWHQDLTITVAEERPVPGYGPWSHKDGAPHVQPPVPLLENMVTIRLHLDETPKVNGALRVIPGSHTTGRIPADVIAVCDTGSAVDCECGPGDVLLMSPLILHSSRRSVDPGRRRVLHFEYAREGDLHPGLEWFERSTNRIGSRQIRF